MKLLAALFIFFLSGYYPHSFGSCSVVLDNPHRYLTWAKNDFLIPSNGLIKQSAKSMALPERLSYYENLWNLMGLRSKMAIDAVHLQMRTISAKNQSLTGEWVQTQIKYIIKEYQDINNLIVDDIANELKNIGFPVQRHKRILEGSSENYTYNVLYFNFKDGGFSSKAAKKIARLQRFFGIQHFTMDLFDSGLRNFGGFYHGKTSRIDVGVAAFRSILLDDIPTEVFMHEISHARFDFARKKAQMDSIFNSTYRALTPEDNLGRTIGYSKFISAEELYNFSHDPLWNTIRFRNTEKYFLREVLGDLKNSVQTVELLGSISKQTGELANEFSVLATRIVDSPIMGLDKFFPLTSDLNLAMKTSEIEYLRILNPETGRLLNIYIPKHLKEKVKMLGDASNYFDLMLRQKLQKMGYKSISEVGAPNSSEVKTLIAELRSNLTPIHTNEISDVMEYVANQQKRLQSVANKTIEEATKVRNAINTLIKEMREQLQATGSLNFLSQPEWSIKLNNLRIHYKKLANITNERFKGSPAYQP